MNPTVKARQVTIEYMTPAGVAKKVFSLKAEDRFGYDLAHKVGESIFLRAWFGNRTFFLPMNLLASIDLDL